MPAVSRRAPLPLAIAALEAMPFYFDFIIRQAQFTDMSASGYGHRYLVFGDHGQGPGTEAEIFAYWAMWLPPAQATLFVKGASYRVTFEPTP